MPDSSLIEILLDTQTETKENENEALSHRDMTSIDLEDPSPKENINDIKLEEIQIPMQKSFSSTVKKTFNSATKGLRRAQSIQESVFGSSVEHEHSNREQLVQQRVENKLLELGILSRKNSIYSFIVYYELGIKIDSNVQDHIIRTLSQEHSAETPVHSQVEQIVNLVVHSHFNLPKMQHAHSSENPHSSLTEAADVHILISLMKKTMSAPAYSNKIIDSPLKKRKGSAVIDFIKPSRELIIGDRMILEMRSITMEYRVARIKMKRR